MLHASIFRWLMCRLWSYASLIRSFIDPSTYYYVSILLIVLLNWSSGKFVALRHILVKDNPIIL